MNETEIKWDLTAETLQTVLGILQDQGALQGVLDEMQSYVDTNIDGSAEQYGIVKQVAESGHQQAGW
jgi:hypothetical protein